jgi:hypothetical protein
MSVTVFPQAAGGGQTLKTDIITTTQSWTAPTGVTRIELLLVAGGGGGGGCANTASHGGGGGGGGGVLQDILAVTPGTSYTVTIGAGGAAGSGASGFGGNGANSSFGSLRICYGGLGGWSSNGTYPTTGATIGSGSGQGTNTGSYPASGGGGASPYHLQNLGNTAAAWLAATYQYKLKQGTNGLVASGNTVQSGNTGLNGYGCGGGGGGYFGTSGGLNGGDGAFHAGNATAATPNTGSGGGGAYFFSSLFTATTGSAGIAIIRYWS